jgi:hypothetical protein
MIASSAPTVESRAVGSILYLDRVDEDTPPRPRAAEHFHQARVYLQPILQ